MPEWPSTRSTSPAPRAAPAPGGLPSTHSVACTRERGFWKILSRIFPENVASLALHERCGFRVVGIYRRHGKLDGVWRDCVIVEKLLDDQPSARTSP